MAGSKRRKITPDQAFTEAYRSHRLLVHGEDAKDLPKALMEDDGEENDADEAADGGGGFFVDGDDSGGGGGFFTEPNEDPPLSTNAPTHLPISEIPHALTLLNLPSNDRSILSVFENGAVEESELHGGRRRGGIPGVKVISRGDFMQVCEVLLMDGSGGESEQEQEEEEEVSQRSTRRRRARPNLREVVEDESDDDEAEVYRESSEDHDDEEEEEEEEYDQTASSKRRRQPPARRQRKRKASSSDDDAPTSSTLTKSQRTQVAHLWSLFTSKLDEIDPNWQGDGKRAPRLTERELQRLAIVIGEKVSEKDIHEMITFATTSFGPVESRTREEARARRETEVKRTGKEGVGIDEFAGVLVRARMV